MNTKTILAILSIAVSMMTATAVVSIPAALAAKTSGSNGLERADQNVHEHACKGQAGPSCQQDVNFHTGTCNGGHTTTVLESIGGCKILGSPREVHSPQH